MTEQYPRYSDIYDIDIKPEDMKNKIMVSNNIKQLIHFVVFYSIPMYAVAGCNSIYESMSIHHFASSSIALRLQLV